MSNYGLNFGFRRSGGDAATREGRYRVPTAGSFRIGDLVAIDDAKPGFIKKADAGAGVIPGVSGFLIQHDAWVSSIYEPAEVDSHGKGKARGGNLCTIWSGPGIKFWLRNTAAENQWDGRSISAVTVVDLAGVAVGDELEWDGSKYVKQASGTAVARVVEVGDSHVEAVLLTA